MQFAAYAQVLMGNGRFISAVHFLMGFISLCSCSIAQRESPLVASVGSEQVSATDLALRLTQIPGFVTSSKQDQQRTAEATVDTLIDECVVYLEAQKRGLSVSNAMIDHEMRQSEAMLGQNALAHFMQSNFLTKERLRRLYDRQLMVFEYWRLLQKEGNLFCDEGLKVQSSQNCTKRRDFLTKLRRNFRISVTPGSITLALAAILESAG